jgi:DNA-binding winged helix-turn-helix (wHTH) protein
MPTKADALVLRILEVFVRSPGELITKQDLVARVWQRRAVTENALTVAIARLRKTLEHESGVRDVLLTVHGRGYRFLRAVVTRDSQLPPPATPENVAPEPSPFVGRERVLAHLGAALSEARSGGGGVMVLTGAPPIWMTPHASR